jgi:predicted transcriptional regulator
MGRPKAENPKSKQIMVRLDAETDRKLEELAEFFKEKKVAVVRRGIEKLYAEIKK